MALERVVRDRRDDRLRAAVACSTRNGNCTDLVAVPACAPSAIFDTPKGQFPVDFAAAASPALFMNWQAMRVPLPGESDGETLGSGTFTIGIIAHKLRVIYGSDKFLGKIDPA